jgi:hypothetical protein
MRRQAGRYDKERKGMQTGHGMARQASRVKQTWQIRHARRQKMAGWQVGKAVNQIESVNQGSSARLAGSQAGER